MADKTQIESAEDTARQRTTIKSAGVPAKLAESERTEDSSGSVATSAPPGAIDGAAQGASKPPIATATASESAPALASLHPHTNRRRTVIAGIAFVVVAAALYFGIPFVSHALNTVSTDDAYVNGHVTFVAARVPGQVVKVLVDDNYRVHKGDILVQLDRQPYQVIVEAKKAALAVAKSNVIVADDQVRAMVGQVRANRYKLQHAIEDVNNQIALLRATVAALETAKAKLARADADYQRALQIRQKNSMAISEQDVDQFKEAYRVGDAQVKQALQQVFQIRVSLGLPEQPEHGDDLTSIPPDLGQTFSTVRQAVADLMQSAAPLGVIASSYNLKPQELIEEFYKRDPEGNLDRIYTKIIAEAPAIKLAQAKLLEAQSDLDQAELNLSYCTVTAEIDGVVTRRDVNPGNNVVAGQSLMAVRSLTDIWIDANFKETQLSELRIGQAVDLDVDMYGSRQTFKGRISGFTMGTGSTLALLPAENATGNFVKVVQRLPVRIDVLDYDADKMPLFIGLSVTPSVHVKEPATGPNAGKVLHPSLPGGQPEKPP
jgi:membrane fusion protein, multidrug efflux system